MISSGTRARGRWRAGALGLGRWSMLGFQDGGSEPVGDLVGLGPPRVRGGVVGAAGLSAQH